MEGMAKIMKVLVELQGQLASVHADSQTTRRRIEERQYKQLTAPVAGEGQTGQFIDLLAGVSLGDDCSRDAATRWRRGKTMFLPVPSGHRDRVNPPRSIAARDGRNLPVHP